MDRKKKGLKNLFFLSIGQIVTITFGFILPRFYIVGYGSEVNGLLSSLNQILIYLALFEAGVGATTLQALYGPIARDDWKAINSVLSATNYFYRRAGKWYFGCLVALSFLYPLVVKSELSYAVVCGVVFFSGIGNVVLFYAQGKYKVLLQADGRNYIITNLSTLLSIATSLSKVFLISRGANIVFVLFVAFCLQMLQAGYIVFYTRKKYQQLSLEAEPDYESINQRHYMLIHQISGMIFQNTDVLILTVVCGLKVVSVYSMFKLVVSHLESILGILTNSVNFILGQTFQTDLKIFVKRIDLFESYYSAISFALFSVALYLFLPFMNLYTADVTDINYMDSKLPILFVVIALLTVMRTPMLYTINYAGHFKLTTPQSVFESVINLIVSLAGVFYYGIYGVLLGTIVALLYRTNDIILYSNKRILHRTPWNTYVIHAVNFVVLFIIQQIYSSVFPVVESYVDLFIVGVGTTLLSLVAFCGAQTVLMPHCRSTIRAILVRKKGTKDDV